MPANSARADEAQKGDPRIGRERLGELVGFGKKNLTPIGRQPGLVKQAYKLQAGERRRIRRLDDHRATCGDRRHDLVDDEIQGMIECRDGGDDADRLDDREGPPIDARRRQPHRDFPASHDAQLVGGIAHAVDGAIGFDQRVGKRLAALARDLTSKMLALALHQDRELPEDLDTSDAVSATQCRSAKSRRGGLDLALERRRIVAIKLTIGARSNAWTTSIMIALRLPQQRPARAGRGRAGCFESRHSSLRT